MVVLVVDLLFCHCHSRYRASSSSKGPQRRIGYDSPLLWLWRLEEGAFSAKHLFM